MDQPGQAPNIGMDKAQLCREETFTDNRVGTVRRLTPVTASGEPDPNRPVTYVGSTQVMTPAGALPLSFELPNDSLEAAIDGFGAAAREAVDRAMEELREMQREAASQIVVPKGGDIPPGGAGGGGIQLP
jgi:hypothetical protein